MLTRRAKAYNRSCSQIAVVSPAISSKFTLEVRGAAENCKNPMKPFTFGVQGLSKS